MTSAPRLTSSKGSPRTSTASMLKLLAIAPCKNQYGRCNHPVCNFARQDPQLIWPNLASGSSTCCSSSSSNTGWSSWTLPCRVDPSVPGMQLEQMHVQKADSLFGLQWVLQLTSWEEGSDKNCHGQSFLFQLISLLRYAQFDGVWPLSQDLLLQHQKGINPAGMNQVRRKPPTTNVLHITKPTACLNC